MAFNGRTPAQYVDFLTREGLATRAGPVPLTSYVSTGTRSPNARAVQELFRSLLDGFSNSMFDTTRESPGRRFETYHGAAHFCGSLAAGSPAVAGLNDLEQLRQRIIARGGRASDWRRVFTGQGSIENIVDVMNFITDHREMLRSLAPATGSGPPPFAAYFTGSGAEDNLQALRRMVAGEVFGLDCLGFTGSYLVWCGAETRYPEWRQHQYLHRLHFAPIDTAAEIRPRTLVLWLETTVQHIAFVDSVTGRTGPRRSSRFAKARPAVPRPTPPCAWFQPAPPAPSPTAATPSPPTSSASPAAIPHCPSPAM